MRLEKKLTGSIRRSLCVVSGAAVLSLASVSSMAAIVCGPGSNIAVPQNIDGVYYNLVTGTGGTTGGGSPGWDINLYETGTAQLFFFWPTVPTAASFGGVATGTIYDVLAAGATIGPAQTYSTAAGGGGAANYVNWHPGSTGQYLGVRFFNETAALINFGWLQLNTTGPGGFPATVVQYCYQNDGTAITAGTTPVSLQKFSVD